MFLMFCKAFYPMQVADENAHKNIKFAICYTIRGTSHYSLLRLGKVIALRRISDYGYITAPL